MGTAKLLNGLPPLGKQQLTESGPSSRPTTPSNPSQQRKLVSYQFSYVKNQPFNVFEELKLDQLPKDKYSDIRHAVKILMLD